MAISTYSELQSSMADFLNRSDLTSVIPTFIALGEARMNRDIRHWQMENRASTTIDGQYLTKPSDWVETIRLHLTGQNTSAMDLLSTQAMADKRQGAENVAGKPKYYAHSEGQFEVFQHDLFQESDLPLLWCGGPHSGRAVRRNLAMRLLRAGDLCFEAHRSDGRCIHRHHQYQ